MSIAPEEIGSATHTRLVERGREWARIGARIDAAAAGSGSTILIEGEPGIGKTALLAATRELAAKRGLEVLHARGADLEREIGFGVARQLLERRARGPDGDALLAGAARLAAGPLGISERRADGPAAPGSGLHGLYWLCANLADRGPLLVAIDDLHWADEPSLQFAAYLAHRVSEHPILICAATRPRPSGAPLAELRDHADDLLCPVALSPDGVATLVRRGLSPDADESFCAACAEATGGNPLLLTEAVAALRTEGVAPIAGEARRVARLRADTLARTVAARLARAGAAAETVAGALAILDGRSSLRRVANLTDLGLDDVAGAVERLREEGILTATNGLDFAHPLIRTTVEGTLGESTRALGHLRAARLLGEDGEEPERIAPHLLAAEPNGDPWAVDVLAAAATAALTAGAPGPAATLLERALAEPPPPEGQTALLTQLGRAQTLAGRPDEGAGALATALGQTVDPRARGEIARDLGTALFVARRLDEAVAVYEDACARLLAADDRGDGTLLAMLEAEATFIRHAVLERVSLRRLEAAVERAAEASPARRNAEALLAYMWGGSCERDGAAVEALARLALDGDGGPQDGFLRLPFAAAALSLCGHSREASRILADGVEAAAAQGDGPRIAFLSSFLARTALETGDARAAEEHGRAALEAYSGGAASISFSLGTLVLPLVARGRLDEAEQLIDAHPETAAEEALFPHSLLLWARGALHLARGRHRAAADDLHRCGEMVDSVGFVSPANIDWRGRAATAHLQLGELDEARRLATEELELARAFGAAHATGRALRVLGLVEGGEPGIALLRESVTTLEQTEAALELGAALVDLGAALRRSGQRRAARDPLRRGLDLAARGGADRLVEQAREELVAAGGRPRRTAIEGPESLTPSELRVARLAAVGRTNREIAQALFVTRRTVEIHLTSAYRKLDIASRNGLAGALDLDTA